MAIGNDDREFWTVKEFAEQTQRTPAAVRAAIARGDLPAHKLCSRSYFIRKDEVYRMFEEARKGR